MYQSQVAVRYAKALLLFATEQKHEDVVATDMQTLSKLFVEVPELRQVVEHPSLTISQKISVMNEVFSKQFCKVSMEFIEFVCHQKRETQLPGIAYNYLSRYANKKGLKHAVFTTAVPMGTSEREAIVRMVESHYNVKLDFSEKVDDSLIGGFIIEIDDKRIDASMATQLAQIRQKLLADF